MSQTDRKYDGPPMQELRHSPVPTPPPPKFRERKTKKTKGPVVTIDPYVSYESKRWHYRDIYKRPRRRSPFSGVSYSIWGELWTKHVLNRISGSAKRDTRTGLVWVENQATKEQLSPEFSSAQGLIYWLEYEGLRRGLLKIESYDGYFGRTEHYKECA